MTAVQLWDDFCTVRFEEARLRGCVVEGKRASAEGAVSWTFVMLGAPGTSRLARSIAPSEQTRPDSICQSAAGGLALGPRLPR